MGGAFTPAPRLQRQTRSPDFALKASNQPLPSPMNTRFPAVARAPPINGCGALYCQAILPVSTSSATNGPSWIEPLATFENALPSRIRPGVLAAGLVVKCINWFIARIYKRWVRGEYAGGDPSAPPFAPGSMSTPAAVGVLNMFLDIMT